MEEQVKPGWKTTEFWVSITAAAGILVLLGYITPEKSSALTEASSQIIGSIMTAVPVTGYALSRGRVKQGVSQIDSTKLIEIISKVLIELSRPSSTKEHDSA